MNLFDTSLYTEGPCDMCGKWRKIDVAKPPIIKITARGCERELTLCDDCYEMVRLRIMEAKDEDPKLS